MKDEKTCFYPLIKTSSTAHWLQIPSELPMTLQYFDIKIPPSVCTLLDLKTDKGY
jgi:hypothetical protein